MNSLTHKNNQASKPVILHAKVKSLVQAKLTVNEPGDIYEQEADAIADRVMRMSSNETAKPVTGLIGKSLQRKCAHCEDEEKRIKPVMRKTEAGNDGMQVSSSFASSLNASRGGGSSLPKATRSFMENAFSTDFSSVKIHTGSQASEMSRGINAKAFTYGSDIYFKSGEYSPNSEGGKKILVHELTHVVQQQEDKSGKKIQRYSDEEWEEGISAMNESELLEVTQNLVNQMNDKLKFTDSTKVNRAALLFGLLIREFKERGLEVTMSNIISGISIEEGARIMNILATMKGDNLAEYAEELRWLHVERWRNEIERLRQRRQDLLAKKQKLVEQQELIIGDIKKRVLELIMELKMEGLKLDVKSYLNDADLDSVFVLQQKLIDYQIARLDNVEYEEEAPIASGAVWALAGTAAVIDTPAPGPGDLIALGIIGGALLSSAVGVTTKERTIKNPRINDDQVTDLQKYLDQIIKRPVAPKTAPKPDLKPPETKTTTDPVPFTRTKDDDEPEKRKTRPPFVLILPLQKAPHLEFYRSWLGTLESDPNYDRGNPAQLDEWHKEHRLGGGSAVQSEVYDRGHALGFTGEPGERLIRVPNWSRTNKAPVKMEVDHKIELQLVPASYRVGVMDSIYNYELLESGANSSSGSLIRNNVTKQRAKQVLFDPSLVAKTLLFEQVQVEGGVLAERWSSKEIINGEQLDAFEKLH